MLSENVYLMKNTDLTHLREGFICQLEVDGNADLFHRIHLTFAKPIKHFFENGWKYYRSVLKSNNIILLFTMYLYFTEAL